MSLDNLVGRTLERVERLSAELASLIQANQASTEALPWKLDVPLPMELFRAFSVLRA